MRPVDTQAMTLYGAQAEAFKHTELDASLTVAECIGFNRTLFARAVNKGYWLGTYVPRIIVKPELTDDFCGFAWWQTNTFNGAYIELSIVGKRAWVVAHEAAHILLMAGRPLHSAFEFHGKEYAAIYIWAISALFGTKWSNRLKRAFAEAHVIAECSLKED